MGAIRGSVRSRNFVVVSLREGAENTQRSSSQLERKAGDSSALSLRARLDRIALTDINSGSPRNIAMQRIGTGTWLENEV